MKIAISGKGGVGKSTLAAVLALLLAEQGKEVLAIDADPDANFAAALGVPEDVQAGITPIAKERALIEERTGAKVRQYGQMFKLNPQVSDIAESHATSYRGVALLVLGASAKGGGGCACPENVLTRTLVNDLVLYKDEALIMDMEAGIEHLGRATATGIDCLLVVVEPGQRSVDCARTIQTMAAEIGLQQVYLVGNKINNQTDRDFLSAAFPEERFLGFIPYHEVIRQSDREGSGVFDVLDDKQRAVFQDILNAVPTPQPK